MARDKLFAGLCFLACINGVGGRIIQSVYRLGWTSALLDSFDTSAIVWCACGIGLLFSYAKDTLQSDRGIWR